MHNTASEGGSSLSDFELNRRDMLAGLLSVGGAMMVRQTAAVTREVAVPTPSAEAPASASQTLPVALTINGSAHRLEQLDVHTTLLDCLRDDLHLTGTKKGCGLGHCGACTVLIDGRRVTSCLTLAVMQQGKQIITIEGLARGEDLHPVQAAFVDFDGYQCGYCTPGQIMSAVACIHEGHAGSDADIREWMSGNICRCGAYPNIVAAIRFAARLGA